MKLLSRLKRSKEETEARIVLITQDEQGQLVCEHNDNGTQEQSGPPVAVISSSLMGCYRIKLPPGIPLKNGWMSIEGKLPKPSEDYHFECISIRGVQYVLYIERDTAQQVQALLVGLSEVTSRITSASLQLNEFARQHATDHGDADMQGLVRITTQQEDGWIVDTQKGDCVHLASIPPGVKASAAPAEILVESNNRLEFLSMTVGLSPNLRAIGINTVAKSNKSSAGVVIPWALAGIVLATSPFLSIGMTNGAANQAGYRAIESFNAKTGRSLETLEKTHDAAMQIRQGMLDAVDARQMLKEFTARAAHLKRTVPEATISAIQISRDSVKSTISGPDVSNDELSFLSGKTSRISETETVWELSREDLKP